MTVVKVCDAIMGSGKTSSTINLLKDNPEKHFIYITPYLTEVDRIVDAIPWARQPEQEPRFKRSKLASVLDMIGKVDVIITTHAGYRMWTQEYIEKIRSYGYTLIMDETVNVLAKASIGSNDIEALHATGAIEKIDEDSYVATGTYNYDGSSLDSVYSYFECNDVATTDDISEGGNVYFWTMPRRAIDAFEEVYILTYMFEGQDLKYYLDLNSIPYKKIGISHDGDEYRFCDEPDYVPPYVKSLGSKIHIHWDKKLNSIGDSRRALSKNWFERSSENTEDCKNNLYNYMRNVMNAKKADIMWSTYKQFEKKLRGNGFKNNFVAFNIRATNQYKDRTVLGYCVNIYQNPAIMKYYNRHGIDFDQDKYALSTMVQWVWRSAIRDGNDIWLYVPSRRMRMLFTEWIESLSGDSILPSHVARSMPPEMYDLLYNIDYTSIEEAANECAASADVLADNIALQIARDKSVLRYMYDAEMLRFSPYVQRKIDADHFVTIAKVFNLAGWLYMNMGDTLHERTVYVDRVGDKHLVGFILPRADYDERIKTRMQDSSVPMLLSTGASFKSIVLSDWEQLKSRPHGSGENPTKATLALKYPCVN